ncbi:diguanylate cyclase [Spiribacter sp. 1M153]|uniref:TackOD1 domain-containing metal-binding protein n=1 Tax=Spiribacter roseus TaxID=1855875 RepID=UPI00349FB571
MDSATARLRLWLVGESARPIWLSDAYTVADGPEHADVAVLMPGTPVEALDDRRASAHAALMPVINASGQSMPGALCDVASLQPALLDEALGVARQVVERLAQLPEIDALADTAALMVLAMAHSRQTSIQATWDFTRPAAVRYAALRGIENPRELLEELAAAELLVRERFDCIHYCPACDGSRLNVREECTECRSSDLGSEPLVHHYRCAYQARESEFLRGRSLECPKCRRALRHYGVDYDKPGVVFVCGHCGAESSDPAVGFLCADCGRHTDSERMDTRTWWHYAITSGGVTALHRGVLPHLSLEASMARGPMGYWVRDFMTLLRFEQAQARRYQRPLSVLILRVHNIEAVSDAWGGRGLSQVFAHLVDVLSECLRQTDAVTARDHVVYVLLPETPMAETEVIARRLRETVETVVASPMQITVERSGGVDGLSTVLEALTD